MPIWKTTENIINPEKPGEYFDENWMNYDKISQYAPPIVPWRESRPIKFEDVDLWEVLVETSGPVGVYAAYTPYAEYYIVMRNYTIEAEFEGPDANKNLEEFLVRNSIWYPYSPNVSEVDSNPFNV